MDRNTKEKQAAVLYKILNKTLAAIYSTEQHNAIALGIVVNYRKFDTRFKKIDFLQKKIKQNISLGNFQHAFRCMCVLRLNIQKLNKDISSFNREKYFK